MTGDPNGTPDPLWKCAGQKPLITHFPCVFFLYMGTRKREGHHLWHLLGALKVSGPDKKIEKISGRQKFQEEGTIRIFFRQCFFLLDSYTLLFTNYSLVFLHFILFSFFICLFISFFPSFYSSLYSSQLLFLIQFYQKPYKDQYYRMQRFICKLIFALDIKTLI